MLLSDGVLFTFQVIANDVDVQRCNLLIHQTKRMCSANLIVTNHEAQHFPSCSLSKGCIEISKVGQQEVGKSVSALQFDRVLCDVPCSGDGTLRKAPDIWRKWYPLHVNLCSKVICLFSLIIHDGHDFGSGMQEWAMAFTASRWRLLCAVMFVETLNN